MVRRESSPQRFYRLSDLALLRTESKMAKTALSGQLSGDPTSAPLSGNWSVGTTSTKDYVQIFQLHSASVAKTHQSAFPEQHSTVLATEDPRTSIFKVVLLQATLPEGTQ